MPIWVDADACPIPVKEILYRAAHRAQVVTTLVANQGLRVPPRLSSKPSRWKRDSMWQIMSSPSRFNPAIW